MSHLLLYDGACSFCRGSVAWLQARDPEGRIAAVPYQDAPSPPMTPELRAACARAVHVITEDGRVLRAGRASLFLLQTIGWRTTARVLGTAPLAAFVELGYWLVSYNRHLLGRIVFSGRGR